MSKVLNDLAVTYITTLSDLKQMNNNDLVDLVHPFNPAHRGKVREALLPFIKKGTIHSRTQTLHTHALTTNSSFANIHCMVYHLFITVPASASYGPDAGKLITLNKIIY